ncbi:MAG TPA: hypothetical protein VHD56_05180 [Tepidisphaeraceae bacterium]|nr:hypothetical protein [Tepidisphaeraceae bacterium]
MSAIRGHFDGKVIVLDEPANLRPNQRVTISPESESPDPEFGTVGYVVKHLGSPISDEDAREMSKAIEEAFGQIEPEDDVEL